MIHQKETILIVDDSRLQRAVLNEIFSEQYNVIEATTVEECLKIIEKQDQPIDLVLLDLIMPGMDGFDVLSHRPLIPEFSKIPVIVLTTSDTTEIQTKAFELGASDFISKPVIPSVARLRINNVLQANRRLQAILKRQEVLRVRAELDEMTHLLNKTTAEHTISHLLMAKPTEPHAMLVIDVDNFKAINDLFGHKMGDHTIAVIAGILASHFPSPDILGRIGGDEFVAFLRNISSKEEVYQKTQELLDAVTDKSAFSIPQSITLSIGLAFSEPYETSYHTLFEKADAALTESKNTGKQCYTEYGGSVHIANRDAKSVFLYTHSRNVASTLEFVFAPSDKLELFSTLSELRDKLSEPDHAIAAIFLDVSNLKDDGTALWQELRTQPLGSSIPVIAICKEGNLTQVRNAVLSDQIDDLIVEPIDVESLKRRIKSGVIRYT